MKQNISTRCLFYFPTRVSWPGRRLCLLKGTPPRETHHCYLAVLCASIALPFAVSFCGSSRCPKPHPFGEAGAGISLYANSSISIAEYSSFRFLRVWVFMREDTCYCILHMSPFYFVAGEFCFWFCLRIHRWHQLVDTNSARTASEEPRSHSSLHTADDVARVERTCLHHMVTLKCWILTILKGIDNPCFGYQRMMLNECTAIDAVCEPAINSRIALMFSGCALYTEVYGHTYFNPIIIPTHLNTIFLYIWFMSNTATSSQVVDIIYIEHNNVARQVRSAQTRPNLSLSFASMYCVTLSDHLKLLPIYFVYLRWL